jgi:Uma2 family endonuclease
MAGTAEKLLTIEDWLAFDDGTDTRYELVEGQLVAMSPTIRRHGTIAQNVGSVIERAVEDRPPCRAVQQAGIEVSTDGDRRGYIADVIMTCEPDDESRTFEAPRLIVEVLSPTTTGLDRKMKVPDYSRLPSVAEIWLVESRERWVVVWSRIEGTWVGTLPMSGSQSFQSRVLGVEVHLDRLYRNTGL